MFEEKVQELKITKNRKYKIANTIILHSLEQIAKDRLDLNIRFYSFLP